MQYHHIFFHSLVVDAELAFDDQRDEKYNFETWMITVKEYKAILKSLYERNYVLVKMADMLQKKVRLPKNKIPLIISFDDVNYYDYMKGYGFADKLVVDEQGRIANEYVKQNGETIITTQADGVAILEEFIKEHPQFSYRNARGILAVTGYEGVLGYRNPEEEKDELEMVVQALKKNGWEFACHSYWHNKAVFKGEKVDEEAAIEDTKLWLEEVVPYVGDTDIYISPFGIPVENYPVFEQFLKDKGFRYFCGVNNIRQYEEKDGAFYFPRINIDGFLFKYRNYEFEYYYGKLEKVLDAGRKNTYELYDKKAEALAMHAIVCSKMPTVYLWGGLGEYITPELIWQKRKEYPKVYTSKKCLQLLKCVGKGIRGFDCSGLIKNYMMGGLTNYKLQAELDMNSAMLLNNSVKSGPIETLPEVRGVCLYMKGHVGIYVGNGYVIESTSNPKFGNGVVRTKLTDRKWLNWFYCPTIEYENLD